MINLFDINGWGKAPENYIKYANTTREWLDSDNKETFNRNKENELIKINGWHNEKVTYTFNEKGFRSDSFEKRCKVLTVGCSQAMGLGINVEDTFSYLFADWLNEPHHNIAIPGSDWSHVTQRIMKWVPKLKPEIVVLRDPPLNRFNWWDMETVCSTAQYNEKELLDCKVNETRPLIDIVQDKNSLWLKTIMLSVIENFLKEQDVKLIRISEKFVTIDNKVSGMYARDLEHIGKLEHKEIFNKLVEITCIK